MRGVLDKLLLRSTGVIPYGYPINMALDIVDASVESQKVNDCVMKSNCV